MRSLEALSCILYALPALLQDVLSQPLLLHIPLLLSFLQSPGEEQSMNLRDILN